MTGFLLLAGATVVLVVGAELFTEHASAAGRRLGVSLLVIGLVLAGAEPEELFTAIFAAVRERPAIAAGDALGANITMLTLVLGLGTLLRPLPFGRRVRTYSVVASAAGLVAALALYGGVARIEGAGLVGVYALFVALTWRLERRPPAIGEVAEIGTEQSSESSSGSGRAVALMVLGIVVMASGGWLAVDGAERVVASLDLEDAAVGLTFVGLATTAELFALVWAAARRGVEELAVAGVLGSALYNATATLGAAALVHPVPAAGLLPAAWFAASIPLVLIVASRRGHLSRQPGWALLASYVVFVVVTVR
ncbi:MAG: sodium:calcium antiporter [Actinobacteria bacterium]|nr:sodium:calcium antiporter [Actinomycetota bacterium]